MDKLARQALLFDFYGELLTEHQRTIYEEVVMEDYSLSEVAEEHGISRQGVHDLVKRSSKILDDYENKLHLVEKFVAIRANVHQIHELTQKYQQLEPEQTMSEIERLSYCILEEF